MNSRIYIATTLIGGLLVGAWAYAGPSGNSGPSITGGKSPLVQMTFEAKWTLTNDPNKFTNGQSKVVFEVPQGRRLVVTDLTGYGMPTGGFTAKSNWEPHCIAPSVLCVYADAAPLWCTGYSQILSAGYSLKTGVFADAGTKISLRMWRNSKLKGSCTMLATATGYLARP